MSRDYDVIGVGVCAFDIVVEVEGLPEEDQKTRETRILPQGGGLVGTALVAVARLGGRAAYLGALGDDAFGEFCVRDFEREGVDTRFIARVPGGSVVVAVILADSSAGTRTIFCSTDNWPVLPPESITEGVVSRAAVVHVDNFQPEPALRAARLARSAGIPVTLDLEGQGGRADDLLANCDYAVVPLGFARDRYGEQEPQRAAAALYEEIAACGGRAAVVTAGPRGSVAVHAEGTIRQPAYFVSVADTTGCGDVYHGAFSLGVARGWELERIMRVASATAALKCRALGGRRGIPSLEEVEDFLESAEPIGDA